MPTYYFNLISEGRQVEDPDGQEIDTLAEAIEVADLSLCEIVGDALKAGASVELEVIIIVDEAGQELARVSTEDSVLPRFKAFAKMRKH